MLSFLYSKICTKLECSSKVIPITIILIIKKKRLFIFKQKAAARNTVPKKGVKKKGSPITHRVFSSYTHEWKIAVISLAAKLPARTEKKAAASSAVYKQKLARQDAVVLASLMVRVFEWEFIQGLHFVQINSAYTGLNIDIFFFFSGQRGFKIIDLPLVVAPTLPASRWESSLFLFSKSMPWGILRHKRTHLWNNPVVSANTSTKLFEIVKLINFLPRFFILNIQTKYIRENFKRMSIVSNNIKLSCQNTEQT